MTQPSAASDAPIPLVVIGGYLGAGKTTLINRLLKSDDARDVAVLVNDFGDVNIDARLIRERTSDVISLENGCICCSIGNSLADALLRIGARVPRPRLLLIEASGVSDPLRIAQIGMLNRTFRLTGIVVVADVERIGATLDDRYVGDIVRRQLASATALVWTKTDLVEASTADHAKRRVAALTGARVTLDATECDGQLAMLVFDGQVPPLHRAWTPAGGGPAVDLPHARIATFTLHSIEPFHKTRLKEALRALPAALLRVKGIVRIGAAAAPYVLQMAGSRIWLTPFAGDVPDDGSTLVFIGRFDADGPDVVKRALDGAQLVAVSGRRPGSSRV